MDKIVLHFKKEEFMCKCGCKTNLINMKIIHILENLREMVKKPIIITSGYRCYNHNKKIGGKENSAHLFGLAADFYVLGISTSIAWVLLEKHNNISGMGHYLDTVPKIIHIDIKDRFQRWVKTKDGKYVYLF